MVRRVTPRSIASRRSMEMKPFDSALANACHFSGFRIPAKGVAVSELKVRPQPPEEVERHRKRCLPRWSRPCLRQFIRSDNGAEFIAEKVRGWQPSAPRRRSSSRGHPGRRLLRELQLPFPRRTPQWRDLLRASGGANPDRTVATPLQLGKTP